MLQLSVTSDDLNTYAQSAVHDLWRCTTEDRTMWSGVNLHLQINKPKSLVLVATTKEGLATLPDFDDKVDRYAQCSGQQLQREVRSILNGASSIFIAHGRGVDNLTLFCK